MLFIIDNYNKNNFKILHCKKIKKMKINFTSQNFLFVYFQFRNILFIKHFKHYIEYKIKFSIFFFFNIKSLACENGS